MKTKQTLLVLAMLFFWGNVHVTYSQAIDFETSYQWIPDQSLWAMTTEKASSGTHSLKLSISDDQLKKNPALISIETDHTIQKVRTAHWNKETVVIGASYEGALLAISQDGFIQWKNELSGFMIHDIWCADVTGDGNDEVIVANADGGIYCIDARGQVLWTFQPSEVPMYAVTVVHKDNQAYVVCGGFDLNIYYLSAQGAQLKKIASSTYSIEKPWGTGYIPPKNLHFSNFLRPMLKADGTEMLVVHGSQNNMQGSGSIYLFDVMADLPFTKVAVKANTPMGEFRISDADGNGRQEIVLGYSGHQNTTHAVRLDLTSGMTKDDWEEYPISGLGFGYSVLQPELIKDGGKDKYLFLVGNHIILANADFSDTGEEKLISKYAYNDMWKDGSKIILASAQSGGSNIHILDTSNPDWKAEYINLNPSGKIQKILNNTATYRNHLATYTKPADERDPLPVYLMTEDTDDGLAKEVADDIRANYTTPMFMGGSHMSQAENWDRSGMANEKYKNKRDARRKYVYTQQQAVDHITAWYAGQPGIAYWGGHGNDPYMFQRSTTEQIIDFAAGKKTILIYPELEDHTADFAWVMDDLFYPLADYAGTRNANIFVRTKHNFWQANIYLPMWEQVLDGKYSNVFVPSMEETSDKAMDISVAGRVGVWASGVFDSWGTRGVPDNPSFDRSRQFSHQRLPNHFMRHIVYHMAYGAQYINNFSVDQDYMSFIWELIAKGALYVPKSEEIVSFSPVHLGMKSPDEHYLNEGSSLKWSTFYNEQFEEENKFVFSRQNATWMAAKVNDWDFSSFASGVKDRRQNFLPSYPNGLVMITPPQEGQFAKTGVPRGALTDHLHPLYKNIVKEYVTDGRYYYSPTGEQYDAGTHAAQVKQGIIDGAAKIPVTVSGDVAWVVAQTSPKHLRLTIIDNGYLNPDDRQAVVTFNTVTPVKMKDILDGTTYNVNDPTQVKVEVPCGLFRFIDIELSSEL